MNVVDLEKENNNPKLRLLDTFVANGNFDLNLVVLWYQSAKF